MELVGLFLIIASIWGFYCGVESFNPLAVALAILNSPNGAAGIVASAKAQRDSSIAVSSTDVGGSTGNGSAGGGGGGGGGGGVGPANNTTAGYQEYAFSQLASKYGISDAANQAALRQLWQRESGWNPKALNKSSGAYGIPQALPATKIPGGLGSTPQQQIDWGLSYIIQRYGTPVNAWNHETANNWY